MENSYKYGFILRYPKGFENITGYAFEHWHYRFIGISHACIMHDKGIKTLEEYCRINIPVNDKQKIISKNSDNS